MDISGIISYITSNWANIIELWLKIIGVASIIVKITPSLKDDDVLKNIIRFAGKYLALNRGSSPKI